MGHANRQYARGTNADTTTAPTASAATSGGTARHANAPNSSHPVHGAASPHHSDSMMPAHSPRLAHDSARATPGGTANRFTGSRAASSWHAPKGHTCRQ